MTRHLLKLVWNRKRQNILLVIELLLSFVVLFTISFLAAYNYSNWRRPLGFEIDRVWTVAMGYPSQGPSDRTATGPAADEQTRARTAAAATLTRVLAALGDLGEIEASATSFPSVPYTRGGWSSAVGARSLDRSGTITYLYAVSDEFAEVFGLRLVAGRWFSRADDGAAAQPVVVNMRLARELFGDDSPLNREIPRMEGGFDLPMRVVGVVEEFRHEGELRPPANALLMRLSAPATLPNLITLRVRPGTPASFEERLVKTLEQIAPDWTFDVRTVESRRDDAIRKAVAPLAVGGILAAFLLLMVALGVTGVVWQSVTLRIQEFGLRRANGATARTIRRQVIVELLLLASLALLPVTLLAQAPVLVGLRAGADAVTPPFVWVASFATSALVIYLLTLLCVWYPSRLATRINPADALHYE